MGDALGVLGRGDAGAGLGVSPPWPPVALVFLRDEYEERTNTPAGDNLPPNGQSTPARAKPM